MIHGEVGAWTEASAACGVVSGRKVERCSAGRFSIRGELAVVLGAVFADGGEDLLLALTGLGFVVGHSARVEVYRGGSAHETAGGCDDEALHPGPLRLHISSSFSGLRGECVSLTVPFGY